MEFESTKMACLRLSPSSVIPNSSIAFCNLNDVRFRGLRCCSRINALKVRLIANPTADHIFGDPPADASSLGSCIKRRLCSFIRSSSRRHSMWSCPVILSRGEATFPGHLLTKFR